MSFRINTRVIIIKENRILLAKNKGSEFWYPPGGGLENNESLPECAVREIREELGIMIKIKSFLYLQEFQDTEEVCFLETFWLAEPGEEVLEFRFGEPIEEVKWFKKEDLKNTLVFPKILKNKFWDNLEYFVGNNNYLGKEFKDKNIK